MSFKQGDYVTYSKQFLRSILAPPNSSSWFRKGIVVDPGGLFVKLLWNGDSEFRYAREDVLILIDKMGYEERACTQVDFDYEWVYGLNNNQKHNSFLLENRKLFS